MADIRKRIKDLESEIGFEKARLVRIKQKYKRDCGNIIKRLLVTDEKYVLKRQRYRNEISSQKELVESLERKRDESTTLIFEEGMQFLASVISLVEKEDYSYRNLTLRDYNQVPLIIGCTNDYPYQIVENKIGLIARKEVAEAIIEQKCCKPSILETKLVERNEKNIIAEKSYDLEIFNGNEVPKELLYDFPYLEQVCNEIVSLKLNNPNVLEKDICEAYLINLKMQLRRKSGVYHK